LNVLFEDNGIGFTTENYTKGIGFINLEARISKLKGSFVIDSKLKRGTIANIDIPIQTAVIKSKYKKGINLKKRLDQLKSNQNT